MPFKSPKKDTKSCTNLNHDEGAIINIEEQIDNFRDIAKYNSTFIKEGKIYRSAALLCCQNPSLIMSLKTLKINTIIDVRSEIEIRQEAYEDEFVSSFDYHWVPFDLAFREELIVKEKKDQLDFYKQFIWYILNYNEKKLLKIFRILSDSSKYPIIIHCHAGRDRTGIVVSLVLLLLGADKKNIIQDYLVSDETTRKEDIEFLFSEIENHGSVRNYLEKIGINSEQQEKIIRILKC